MSCACGEQQVRHVGGREICRYCLMTDDKIRRSVAEEFRKYNIGDPLDLGPHEIARLCFDVTPEEMVNELRDMLEPGLLLGSPKHGLFVPHEEALTRELVKQAQGSMLGQMLAYATLNFQIIHRVAAKTGEGLPTSAPYRCETIVRALRNGLDFLQTIHPVVVRNVKASMLMQMDEKSNKKAV